MFFKKMMVQLLIYYRCEADPEVLAKYVRALLKDDTEHQDPKAHCVDELRDFLKENTETFVDDLFYAIECKFHMMSASVAT